VLIKAYQKIKEFALKLQASYENLVGRIQSLLRDLDPDERRPFFHTLKRRCLKWLKPNSLMMVSNDELMTDFLFENWGIDLEKSDSRARMIEMKIVALSSIFTDFIRNFHQEFDNPYSIPRIKTIFEDIQRKAMILGSCVEKRVIFANGSHHAMSYRYKTTFDISVIEPVYEVEYCGKFCYDDLKTWAQRFEDSLHKAMSEVMRSDKTEVLRDLACRYGDMRDLLYDLENRGNVSMIYQLLEKASEFHDNGKKRYFLTKVGEDCCYGREGDELDQRDIKNFSLKYFGDDVTDQGGRCIARVAQKSKSLSLSESLPLVFS
jgi:hypothetical protein